MADSSHSCIPEENENGQAGGGLKSAAMLGIALSVGASGVIVSQSEASAAISAPTTPTAESFSTGSEVPASTDEGVVAGSEAAGDVVGYHTVESGQSLWQIAQQHRVGLRELKEANALPPETSIRVGQVLRVPATSQAAEAQMASSTLIASLVPEEASALATTQPAAPQLETQLSEKPTVEVALNELPSEEASEAKPSDEEAIVLESEPTASEISIEIADASQEIAQVQTQSVESVPVVTALATPSSFSHYQVRSGDTLNKIASSLGTTSEALMRANSLVNPNVILAGDTLRVPASVGYIPAQSSSETIARRDGLAQRASSEISTSNQLAYLRSTVARTDSPELLEDLRGAAPQEPASVGGEIVTKEDLLSSRSDSGEVDPYVANLLEEVREIRSRSVSVSEVESDISEVALVDDVSVEPDSPSLLARRNEQSSPSHISERIARSEQTAIEDVDSELLAAAPLSPDAYIPARRPAANLEVSPDMPMLPGADEYLPEAPDYFDGYVWPARGTLTSGYGWRWGRMHRGVDVAGPVGTPIVAAGAGVVERAGWNSGGYGNLVEIRHPDGSMTRYAHNNTLNVSVGQTVRQGQQIAEMGSTGYSTGPHLHFEIHQGGSGAVNPMSYLPNR